MKLRSRLHQSIDGAVAEAAKLIRDPNLQMHPNDIRNRSGLATSNGFATGSSSKSPSKLARDPKVHDAARVYYKSGFNKEYAGSAM